MSIATYQKISVIAPKLRSPPAKCHELRPKFNPKVHPACSGIVLYENGHERGYSNIYFSDDFVSRLGKLMMYGVSAAFPVYLKATYKKGIKKWHTRCIYFSSRESVLLWATDDYPDWFGKVFTPKP